MPRKYGHRRPRRRIFVNTAGCLHTPVVAGGRKASVRVKEFVWLNTVIGNAETALRSTHHSMKGKYAQRYLSEFERRAA